MTNAGHEALPTVPLALIGLEGRIMLRVASGNRSPMCDGVSRRDLLKIGAFGLGGLALPDLLRASAGLQDGSYVRDKAVILLFLAGGPSQHETFDPKPDGIGASTSLAGYIPTALPGVRFASCFPKMARLADQLTIVRSLSLHLFWRAENQRKSWAIQRVNGRRNARSQARIVSSAHRSRCTTTSWNVPPPILLHAACL